jgi:curved DNA-binding protein CbpA
MRVNPYEVLGKWGTDDGKPLPRGADKAMIKKAYRKASSRAHPDRHGGDTKAMVAVNVAHDILSDPRRRERYDLGQDDEATEPVELRARQVLGQAFMQAIMTEGRVNYVSLTHGILQKMANDNQRAMVEMDGLLKKITERSKLINFEPKDAGQVDVFADQMTAAIAGLRDQREHAEQTVKACDLARELLVAYKCTVSQEMQYSRQPTLLELMLKG